MNDHAPAPPDTAVPAPRSPRGMALSDGAFYVAMSLIGATYVLLIVAMLGADAAFMVQRTVDAAVATRGPCVGTGALLASRLTISAGTPGLPGSQGLDTATALATAHACQQVPTLRSVMGSIVVANPILKALADRKIQYSIWLSMISCTLSAVLSVFVAVPLGYLMARHRFAGQRLLDAILDIPIVLPPLVVGLSLLILFQFVPFRWFARGVVYQVPAVVLAQFSVACAFAVRTMRATFDHIDVRCEQVALSLGCTRLQAFGSVVLPEASRGMMTALTLAWARSLGEFGPLLIFAGATRMKTEVLSTSVFLEMNVGDLEAGVAVSLIMVVAAVAVLIVTRLWGAKEMGL